MAIFPKKKSENYTNAIINLSIMSENIELLQVYTYFYSPTPSAM